MADGRQIAHNTPLADTRKRILFTQLKMLKMGDKKLNNVSQPDLQQADVASSASKVTRTRRHMSANIDGMLRNYKRRSMAGLITDENGREMSDAEARKFLAECQAKGWKRIPCGDCEGFDHFDKGCPGHPIEDKDAE